VVDGIRIRLVVAIVAVRREAATSGIEIETTIAIGEIETTIAIDAIGMIEGTRGRMTAEMTGIDRAMTEKEDGTQSVCFGLV
jgi:hypothetical protein